MNWSDKTWQECTGIYNKILTMPFLTELIAGSLQLEKFKFYIEQDSNYLEKFGRTLSLIAARAHHTSHVLDFIRFAEGAIVVENALHAGYFADYDIQSKAPLSPACHYYTSFLLSTAALEQVEIAMAAVLPCFVIYKKAGDYILQQQKNPDNPYKKWIGAYAGEEFGELVKKAVSICDEAAETCTLQQQQAMTEAFNTACKLEWLFWNSAWNLEKWDCYLF